MSVPLALRSLAVAIVLLAILDPAVTSLRRTDAVVAVVASDPSGDVDLAERVASRLDDRFTTVTGPFSGAAASVVVGGRIPAGAEGLPSPVFAVVPSAELPDVRLRRVDVPRRAPLRARIPVAVDLRVAGAAGEVVDIVLRAGSLVLDRHEISVDSDDERVRARLSAVPPSEGPLSLRVEASIGGRGDVAAGELLVDVVDERWSVLFFDHRPSWMSTFVRRAVEQDPRFEVTTRVHTSTGLGTEFGSPPSGLGGASDLARFDAVVVGAPEDLADGDAAGLERFLREEGASVVLLLDRVAPGAHDRLMGVEAWSATDGTDVALRRRGAGDPAADPPLPALRGRELASPDALPPGARVHLEAGAGDAAVWSVPVGAGRLVVSGALDAWQFRDPETSGFEEFWRELLSDAAARGRERLDARVVGGDRAVAPGSRVQLEVGLPDAALDEAAGESGDESADEVGARVVAAVTSAADTPIRLWPVARPGRFRAWVRAPDRPGLHRIAVEAGELRAEVPLIVDSAATRGPPDDSDLIRAWAAARGGTMRDADDLDGLASEIAAALGPDRRRERWHPMRSAWWIIPFALALGGEWWWRRRRGLA